MCGFAGELRRAAISPAQLDAEVARMNARLRHRGPDSTGYWGDPSNVLALGFSRLAIQDLSPEANQPMTSESGRYVIVYNGEIYNADELRALIGRSPKSFRTHSDTEVLLACFEKLGLERTLQAANGMWAIALWDTQKRKLQLARDRFGKKPLHYWVADDACRFASEIKALLASDAPRPSLCRDALEAYIALTYIPAPLSIFDGIRKIRPGHIVTVDEQLQVAERPFWSLEEVMARASSSNTRFDDLIDETGALFEDAVRRRLVSDVPVGVLLSGGVDSSLVAYAVGRKLGAPLESFTIALEDAVLDESQHAAAVSAELGVPNHVLKLSFGDALGLVESIADSLDEPSGDYSAIPTYAVCKLARSKVTVLLTGDGGDEVFGGYPRYLWAQGWRRIVAAAYARSRTKKFSLSDRELALEIYRRLMTTGADGGSMAAPSLDRLAGGLTGARSQSVLQTLRMIDFLFYLPDDILVKIDRMSMANSVELRAPFLDFRLVEKSWTMPDHALVAGGVRKRITRELFARYLNRKRLQPQKFGFGLPIGSWLTGPLREQTEAAIAALGRDIDFPLPADYVRQWWRRTQAGDPTAAHRTWLVLALWQWHARWRTAKAAHA